MNKEKLKKQVEQLAKANKRLSEALKLAPTEIHKDATIQRFEFTFELTWKMIKSLAYEKGVEAASPRDSLRIAAQLDLIEDIETWFGFLDARNIASHVYDQKMAESVYRQAKKFALEVERLLSKAKKFSAELS
ncbi:MAG: HI0074 family nucleotidyltransferase substrate-binding subunit [Patescibacteria group bacterium]|nr:nucleotidyltransferase substrate binding protein [Patescibacteria group bacterium]